MHSAAALRENVWKRVLTFLADIGMITVFIQLTEVEYHMEYDP